MAILAARVASPATVMLAAAMPAFVEMSERSPPVVVTEPSVTPPEAVGVELAPAIRATMSSAPPLALTVAPRPARKPVATETKAPALSVASRATSMLVAVMPAFVEVTDRALYLADGASRTTAFSYGHIRYSRIILKSDSGRVHGIIARPGCTIRQRVSRSLIMESPEQAFTQPLQGLDCIGTLACQRGDQGVGHGEGGGRRVRQEAVAGRGKEGHVGQRHQRR